jgi:hypothetical protein
MRLDALGAARPPFFSLLAQRKEGKRKGTPTAWSPLRSDCPALLGQNRRCGTPSLRSVRQSSLLPVLSCGARLHRRGPRAHRGRLQRQPPSMQPSIAVLGGGKRALSDRAQPRGKLGRSPEAIQGVGQAVPAVVGHSPTRCSVVDYCHPFPVDAAEHRRDQTDQREDCLSERSERVPQRPFGIEKRREPLVADEGQVSGCPFFSSLFFGQAKKRDLRAG